MFYVFFLLYFSIFVCVQAPEFFYKTLEKKLQIKTLPGLMSFTDALSDLPSKWPCRPMTLSVTCLYMTKMTWALLTCSVTYCPCDQVIWATVTFTVTSVYMTTSVWTSDTHLLSTSAQDQFSRRSLHNLLTWPTQHEPECCTQFPPVHWMKSPWASRLHSSEAPSA